MQTFTFAAIVEQPGESRTQCERLLEADISHISRGWEPMTTSKWIFPLYFVAQYTTPEIHFPNGNSTSIAHKAYRLLRLQSLLVFCNKTWHFGGLRSSACGASFPTNTMSGALPMHKCSNSRAYSAARGPLSPSTNFSEELTFTVGVIGQNLIPVCSQRAITTLHEIVHDE